MSDDEKQQTDKLFKRHNDRLHELLKDQQVIRRGNVERNEYCYMEFEPEDPNRKHFRPKTSLCDLEVSDFMLKYIEPEYGGDWGGWLEVFPKADHDLKSVCLHWGNRIQQFSSSVLYKLRKKAKLSYFIGSHIKNLDHFTDSRIKLTNLAKLSVISEALKYMEQQYKQTVTKKVYYETYGDEFERFKQRLQSVVDVLLKANCNNVWDYILPQGNTECKLELIHDYDGNFVKFVVSDDECFYRIGVMTS